MRYVLALLVCLATFTGVSVAFAAETAPAEPGILELAKPIFDAFSGGQGFLAAALMLVLLVTAARKYGAARFPWLASGPAGAAMTLLGSFGGAAATMLAAGSLPTWGLALIAFKIALTAAGGYSLIKELAAPLLRKLETKAPAWMQPFIRPILDLTLWAFEKRGAVAKAEEAGAAAVAAKPASGARAAAGTGKQFP